MRRETTSAVKLIVGLVTGLVAIPSLLAAYAVLTAVRVVVEWITGDAEDWR